MKCYNKVPIAVASFLGVMLVGCMTLEERLASSDPSIKRDAEIELVRETFKVGSKQARLAAVQKVTNSDILVAIAKSAKENTKDEGVAAVEKVSNKDSLTEIAKCSRVKEVGVAACRKISDQAVCCDLAQNATLADTRAVAYEKIQDQEKLLSIAQTTRDRAIKLSAMKRVSDKEKLLNIAFSASASQSTGSAKSETNMDKMTAMKKKMSQKKSSQGQINNASASVDGGLVDAFIEYCNDDAVFIKMVTLYGDRLSAAQCAVVKSKSKNATVHENIDSIADIKIVNALRVKLNPRLPMGRDWIHADEYYTYFKQIKNKNVKEQLFVDTCRCITQRQSWFKYVKEWKEMVNELSISCILKCVDGEADSLADYGNCVEGKNILPFLREVMTDKNLGRVHYSARMEEWFKNLIIKVGESDEKSVIAVLSTKTPKRCLREIVNNFKSSDAAIAFLKKGFDEVEDYMIRDCMLKFNEVEQERILKVAKMRFGQNKDKVCLGPFYVGMPLCDAIVQRKALGISGKDAWFTLANVENENPEVIENWKISAMAFSPKASLKFLDCEDSLILQQAIKQCVKKEKGKAKSWDYMSEIKANLDVSMSSSTRINLFSPTGTTTDYDYDAKIWNGYKNTKLGILIRHNDKTGDIVFSSL